MMPFENDIINSLAVLQKGGLLLYPTDTVWGIGCDAGDAEAVAKIYTLKKRQDNKSMIVLLAEEKEITNYVSQPYPKIFDYIKGVKKPTTFIYEGAINLASNLVASDSSIAIRVTADPFCRELIKRFGKPLVSTSANISGYPPASLFADIDIEIKKGVDYIVEYRQDDDTVSTPSAIVKWNVDGSFTIIRS